MQEELTELGGMIMLTTWGKLGYYKENKKDYVWNVGIHWGCLFKLSYLKVLVNEKLEQHTKNSDFVGMKIWVLLQVKIRTWNGW